MTLQGLRRELYKLFKSKNIESPETESGLLLMHFFNLTKTQLLLESFEITPQNYAEINTLAKRRTDGEPLRYITGICPFMNLEFDVNPSTLIPRQETEILVYAVSEYLAGFSAPTSLWDIGCGSGCIGISLAHRHPELHVTEFDISDHALKTAANTARRYGLSVRIDFVNHDILSGMPQLPSPQVIVSNPPYIPTKEIDTLQREVKDFEPISALDGGEDGLIFYRKISANAPLPPNGLLAFEIGYDQGASVCSIMRNHGYKNVTLIKDFSGNPRVVTGYKA